MTTLKRIYLLSDAEILDLYARPDFNAGEREIYFSMDSRDLEAMNKYATTKTRAYFILQLGYFKARQQFFNFEFQEVRTDLTYVLTKYFKISKGRFTGCITRQSISLQKKAILKLFDYQDLPAHQNNSAEEHLAELLRYYPRGHDAFRHLLTYFDHQKIVIPTYRNLQDMFTRAFAKENERLSRLVLLIPKAQQEKLSELLEREDGISKLNVIRSDQKNFQYTAIKAEADKAMPIEGLYKFSKEFLPSLSLSTHAIHDYSELAEQYAASRLRRFAKDQQFLQTLCFVHHRYQQIMDNLITSFIHHTRAILNAAKTYSEAAIKEHGSGLVVDLPKLASFLKWFPNRKEGMTHEELNQEAYTGRLENLSVFVR